MEKKFIGVLGVVGLGLIQAFGALQISFKQIHTTPPRGFGNSLGAPYSEGGTVFFARNDGVDFGIYTEPGGYLVRWGETVDGAQLNNIGIGSVRNGVLAAVAADNCCSGSSNQFFGSLYLFENGLGSRVFDRNVPVPGYNNPINTAAISSSYDGRAMAFRLPRITTTPQQHASIVLLEDRAVSVLADNMTAVPDGGGATFSDFGQPYIHNGQVVFIGKAAGVTGIYLWDGQLSKIVDGNTPRPENPGVNFGSLFQDNSPVRDGADTAFVHDGSPRGVFKTVGGQLARVADTTFDIPGGTGKFFNFASVSLQNGKVVFLGWRDNQFAPPREFGIYTDFGGALERIVDVHTPLDGKVPWTFFIARGQALVGNKVYFMVEFEDRSNAIYVATLDPPNTLRHSEPVLGSQIWQSGLVHIVDEIVRIRPGSRLLIEPGAIVKFAPGAGIIVEEGGRLDAPATASAPIIFTLLTDDSVGGDTNQDGDATQPLERDWEGITIRGSAQFNLSEFLDVRFVREPVAGCCYQSYNLEFPPGFSAIANQLHYLDNTVSVILPDVPDGTTLYKWDSANQNFVVNGWFAGAWQMPTQTLAPGEGAFINLPTPARLTFLGQKNVPQLPLVLEPGFNLVARQVPGPAVFTNIVGRTPAHGTAVYRYRPGNEIAPLDRENYDIETFRNGVWHDQPPKANIGEALFITELEPVTIIDHPRSVFNAQFGASVTFSVHALGSGPLLYQWRLNGANIPGATGPDLVINNLEPVHLGNYSCTVANPVGAVDSDIAALSVSLPALALADQFDDRAQVSSFSFRGRGNNFNATTELAEPLHGGEPGGSSVWLQWIAPASGIVRFSTAGSDFDTLLAVYKMGPNGLEELASNDDDEGFFRSFVEVRVEANQACEVAIDGYLGAQGMIVLSWTLEPTTDLGPRILVQPDDQIVNLNEAALFHVVAQGSALNYQWFFEGAPIPGATTDTLQVPGATLQQVGSYRVRIASGQRSVLSRPASLQINFTPDQAVNLARNKYFPVPRGFIPEPSFQIAPASVTRGYTTTVGFSTATAPKQANEPNHCGVVGGASKWYYYIASTNGTLCVSTEGSNFDTVLAVYTNPGLTFATLMEVECDNDSGSNNTSKVCFEAIMGAVYYTAVDGVNDPVSGDPAIGTVVLTYQMVLPLTFSSAGMNGAGTNEFTATVTGTPLLSTTLLTSEDFIAWIPIMTTSNEFGSFSFTNYTGTNSLRRYYRGLNSF